VTGGITLPAKRTPLEVSMGNLPRMSRLFALVLLASFAASAGAQKPAAKLTWGPVPPFLPAGAKMAVVSGDPMKAGKFALQLKMPSGYTFPAHQHPTEEHLEVKSGAFKIGMGDAFDAKKLKTLKTGETANVPAKMNHYARTSGPTVLEVSGTGPFAITYVATGNSTVPSKSK
jgi:mannose-6-phosphate isomerase-like protein (cupin superfamily)